MKVIEFLNTFVFGPALPLVLFSVGFVLLIRYRFFTVTHLIDIIRVLTRKNDSESGISPFKAVTVALAGTLGVGNIVGVATAITLGGAGAVFWMWMSALFAMLIKYSEVVLAVRYRHSDNGCYHGGAFYYISEGVKKDGIAVIFAVLMLINSVFIGNIIQVKSAAEACNETFGIVSAATGGVIAVLVFIVILGGVKSISDFTVKLIPLLSVVYVLISVYIIAANSYKIPYIIELIFIEAFKPESAAGGMGGYLLMRSLRFGAARGIMSNEAGSGTAPTAHASSNTKSPVEQGFWGIFEVFADTIVLCTMTAFVILIFYDSLEGYDGMILALKAYEMGAGKAAGCILSGSVVCFAFATAVCWAYYGMESLEFLGCSGLLRKIYKLMYCLLCIYGAVTSTWFIWEISDLIVSVMTVINTVCVCRMSGQVSDMTYAYFKTASGKLKNVLSSMSAGMDST